MRLVRRRLVLNMSVRVEVRSIQRILDPRYPWCWDMLEEELVDINDIKPVVVPNVHVSSCQTSEAIRLASDNQSLNKILSRLADHAPRREGILDLYNSLEETDLVSSIRVEGRASDKHLVDQNTKCPVVNTLIVTLGQNNLWSQIFGCTTKCVRFVGNDLGETQIDKNAVTFSIDKDILGL